jgi:hypothetical protein
MVRAGISLPALMQLMGHADIQTTLLYVQMTPQDVYVEYHSVTADSFVLGFREHEALSRSAVAATVVCCIPASSYPFLCVDRVRCQKAASTS